ncbi:autotransporter-associated N-terminal domain-containing protein [Fusobacterium vincentii]|uniref:autotransporter-associated N-terminal domain-containing protein n=1 Tax=Fusobacterium vincentii TaxID=155615 RepID=UPI000C1BD19C|nr:autotransporter-associated N-terminal domain-containing protein [Fusobacterium vincentii]ATV06556.1 autotransporter domain-containing protein [Fusobacterium vincentii]BET14124.1 autotransporter-associated N-terminal domain-containing protein [Fusobacterium vincentii]
MGNNNLYKVENTLRSIAKRYKSVKYSLGLAILFLMMGVGAFSEEVNPGANGVPTREEIATSRENLKNSVGSLQSKIDEARAENSKGLTGLRLELIQLIEQGDQVVKSPWASWQFGANYMYSKWNGTYKGRGDKAEKYPYEGIFTRSKDPFERYTSPESPNYGLLPTSTNPYSATTSSRKGLRSGYGIASTTPKQEPLTVLNVDASIKPKDVYRDPVTAPTVDVKAPVLQALNVPNLLPPSLDIPEPVKPNVTLVLPTPNTNPFTDFCFTCGTQNGVHQTDNDKPFKEAEHNTADGNDPDKTPNWADGKDNKFWTGFNPVTGLLTPNSGINGNIRNFTYSYNAKTDWAPRTAAALYFNKSYDERARKDKNKGLSAENMKNPKPSVVGFEAKNIDVYVAGNVSDKFGNNAGKTHGNHDGAIGIHTVWDGTLTDIRGHLYGRANFLSIETWHAGNLQFKRVSINIERNDAKGIKANENTLFYIYPATYETIASHNFWAGAPKQRGGFIGEVNAKIPSNRNIVYSVLGAQGSFEITSTGKYELEGADNIVYSGLGYSPNFNNLKGSGIVEDLYNKGLTPSIKLDKAPESYGDGNVVMLFNNRIGLGTKAVYDSPTNSKGEYIVGTPADAPNAPIRRANWEKSGVGIYQGEIRAKAIIGNKLNMANSGTQTAAGNTSTVINSDGSEIEKTGDANYVENNIGIYARSGQRGAEGGAKIIPSQDLGAKDAARNTNFDKDEIHSLQVNDIDISFGKYSKNGIMMVSENGTVLDVAMDTNKHEGKDTTTVPIMTGDIKDHGTADLNGKISYNDADNEAATGTIIAYSDGTWKNAIHKMKSDEAKKFEGKSSEINIGRNVVLTARYKKFADGTESTPVAYVAKNSGKVTAHGTTKAKGFGAILGYAESAGKVTLKKEAEAVNEWVKKDAATKPYLYNNIGGYAKGNGSTVDFEKDLKINGMAGFADGAGATVNLKGNANKVQTGKGGGLAAINGGVVNFGGGDIYHETTASTNNVGANQGDNTGDHTQSTPFYADSSSHINFTGATNLNISDGVLIPGTKADYAAATGTVTKYNGMSNVTVNLTGNNVVLASNNGIDKVWDGTTIADLVKNTMKVAAFNANGHSYKIYYINGTFKIDSNINVGSTSDDFNKVGLSREVVTINSGRTVSSTVGKGLAMGSNDSANKDADNSKTQFINNGTVDIKGGSLSAGTIGLNISYGQIHNKSTINVENGIGAYGINGSTLTNDTTGKINITTQGVGMAAFTSANTLQTYGTDKKIADNKLTTTDKTFEIINKGQVTVNGNKSVGLYGDTNGNSSKLSNSNGIITNSGKLTLTGDESVGIVSKRATVELNGTGNSDIVVGKKGIGVYAEKSKVKFNSDYGVEVKDGGTGVFVKNDGSNIIPSGANTLKLKYSGSNTGTGVGLFYEGGTGANLLNTLNVKLMDTVGTTGGLIGVYTAGGGKLTNTATISGDKGYGIISKGTEIVNQGTVTLTNALTLSKPSVGLLTQAGDNITNEGTVTVGNNSVGVYGKKVLNQGTIAVGDGGTGIYSEGGNVDLDATSKINTGANKAVGVFTKGSGQTITASAGSTMTIGNSSFGFLNEGKGNTINSNVANQTLGTDGTYIYSSDKSGTVNNNTTLTSTGSYNYGLYSAGTVKNNADINFGTGLGNVGIYSTHGGRATNLAGRNITVGASYIDPNNSLNNRYAVGMAAGFTPTEEEKRAGKTPYTGNIVNEGTINVNGQYSIGMYGTGVGTKVYNGTSTNKNATINLGASNTTGMYLDNGAYGYNYGTIRSVGTGLSKVVGIVVKNGSTIENHGKIELTADDAVGILSKGNAGGDNPGIIKNYGTFNINGVTNPNDSSVIKQSSGGQDLGKAMGNVKIDVPKGSSVGTITVNGKPVVPTLATTSAKEYRDMEISKIGMYIDTSNKRFTNPINGLSALSRLKTADLIMGNEAAQSTTSKYIQVDQKILKPYNEMIKKNPQIKKWNIYAGALTWMATVSQDKNDGTMKSAYLAKVPYTHWAGNQSTPVDKKDTYNFLDGLEQRYGVEGIGTRENGVFQKLNGIGKNEQILFFQAVDEMMGHQYANVQQRVQSTGIILDKEFKYLRDEWRTASKDSNKVKVFGTNGEYKTDTAGVIDYKNYGYGVAYLHEDEDIKLGRGIGWYTGIIHNTFKFKDIGKSKEQMLQAKVGLLKSVPFDDNNSLNWTISGDIFVGRNTMHRKFLVVDEIFNAKSKYYTYGIGIKNEIGKEFRLSEGFTLRPYAALKLEYGRVSKIREKSGEIKLEVKQNHYFSVRPEIGAELGFKHYFGMKALKTTLGVAYENELGRVANGKNKARVVDTSADWFNIRGEKEDRKGNVKFDLNVGLDNTRVGVTANVGYDTKGKNLRGGLGLRVIF